MGNSGELYKEIIRAEINEIWKSGEILKDMKVIIK